MYYEFLVVHLDAPYVLLSAVTTGLMIRIFYKPYMYLRLNIRVIISILLFLLNAIIIVPGIVFLYRWLLICGFYQPSGFFNLNTTCYKNTISLNIL